MHPFYTYPSTLVAFAVWGVAGFMAQPTLASIMVHLVVLPGLLLLALWMAHHEGRRASE